MFSDVPALAEKLAVGKLAAKKEAVIGLTLLLGTAVAAPFIRQQLVSGIVVNAVLILAVCLYGAREGLILALVPSSVALAVGLLPPVLAPMVPFIIIGNAILVLAVDFLRKLDFWAGALVGAVLKFAFLASTSSVVIGLLVNNRPAAKVAAMMSTPQLVTALGGAIVAFGVIRLVRLAERRRGTAQ